MIRILIVAAVVHSALSVTDQSLDDLINEIFGIESEDANDNDLAFSSCNDVQGKGQGCYECYFCNNTLLQDSRIKGGQVQLQLKDSSCSTTEVCCLKQNDLLNLRSSEECGKSNPEGKPRKRRPAPRAVLQGELPWQAWIYKKNSATPLCAVTFVHEDSKALLTLASCLQGLSADSVEVAFIKGGPRSAVRRVIVHGSYKPGGDSNNIALVQLRSLESTPTWAATACLPVAPPSHAAPCLTTSDKAIRLNTVIPLRKACTANKTAPPDSLTCAVAPPGDYAPEKAAGLYCKELHVTRPAYIVHGVAISRQDDAVTTYVNVWHFASWINQQLGIN